MNLTTLFYKLFPRLRDRAAARESAGEACRALRPNDPVLGASVCADEPGRYVVRVFCGHRRPSDLTHLLPPWRECLIFGVAKDTRRAELIADDEKYRPTVR